MKLSTLFKRPVSVPPLPSAETLDGLTSGSFVLLGAKECARSSLVQYLVEHAAADRKRIVALTASDMAISPRASIIRGQEDAFDRYARIHEISLYGALGSSDVANFVDVALEKCLAEAFESSEGKDDVILLLEETAGYLNADMSRRLASLLGWRNLQVWLVQTSAYDFRRNPLLELVLDTRPRVALPFSHAWSDDYSKLLHPSTYALAERATYQPGFHVDFVIERNWEARLYRLPFEPQRKPAPRIHSPIIREMVRRDLASEEREPITRPLPPVLVKEPLPAPKKSRRGDITREEW